MMTELNNKPTREKTRASLWMIRGLVHSIAVLVIAVLSVVPFVNSFSLQAIRFQMEMGAGPVEPVQVLLHLGIAAAVWAMICIVWEYLRTLRKEQGTGLRLVKARGTVIVETLIVFPVILLLILGISQLAVTNITNMLSNAAAFHAARAVSVWRGEPDCTGECSPNEMGRLQAAMILAPVVPGNSIGYRTDSMPEHLRQALGIMVASQNPLVSSDMGYFGISDAEQYLNEQDQSFSFAAAFDSSSFPKRGAIKLIGAYSTVDVTSAQSGDILTVEMTYRHLVAMPMVGYLFGELDTIEGRTGFYSTFSRRVQRATNPAPNRHLPDGTGNVIEPPRRFF